MISNLPKKGFMVNKKGHHIFFYHIQDGRETGIRTKISHTAKMKDISNDIISAIKRQLKLDTNAEVKDLIECPMDEATYIGLLRKKGEL